MIDPGTIERLASLERRLQMADARLGDIDTRLLTAEASARLAGMEAAQYDPVLGVPTFGPVLYEISTLGCGLQRIPDVRVTGSLFWSDLDLGIFVSVGDNFDVTSDASGIARFYGRQIVEAGDFGGVVTAQRFVGRPERGDLGVYYRARAWRPAGTSAFWVDPPPTFNWTTGAPTDPPLVGTVSFGVTQQVITGTPPNYTCGPVNRGPYPLRNFFTVDGVTGTGDKTFGAGPFVFGNTLTVTKIRNGSTYSWNGFAWMGNLAGAYDVTWFFAGGNTTTEPTLQGRVLRVNPGGGERPVDRTSNNTGATPAPTFLTSAATAPSSASGTGAAPGWQLSYTYDFTGTAFSTLTGITTVTVTSA